jgi:hypothetical protein
MPGTSDSRHEKESVVPQMTNMKSLLVLPVTVLLVGCSQAPAPAPVAETHGVGSIVRLDPAFDSLAN